MPKKIRDIFDYFDEMIEDMQKEFEEFERELMRRASTSSTGEIGPYVYGFRVTVGPDGKPQIQEFGNVKRLGSKPVISNEREPLVDIIEKDNDIRVLAEIPGADKDKIKVSINGDKLFITADAQDKKYSKTVELPAEVDEDSVKATYKNGVLEINLKKKQQSFKGKEIKIE
ncbi:heat-shock protein Hsp20 [Sulfolobales archaeon HS-7]|nr:heat-shock protein Hsp20 [Sulfolobales archaeon HS-7]